jgi:hypothetical protein
MAGLQARERDRANQTFADEQWRPHVSADAVGRQPFVLRKRLLHLQVLTDVCAATAADEGDSGTHERHALGEAILGKLEAASGDVSKRLAPSALDARNVNCVRPQQIVLDSHDRHGIDGNERFERTGNRLEHRGELELAVRRLRDLQQDPLLVLYRKMARGNPP